MRIMLIQPCSNRMSNGKDPKTFLMPLGLMYLAGTLRANGFNEIKILDCMMLGFNTEKVWKKDYIQYGLSKEEIKAQIKQYNPDVVATSCMCSLRKYQCYEVCEIAKEVNSDIITVVGGNHITCFPEEALKHESIEFAILGEGEEPFLKLVQTFTLFEGVRILDEGKLNKIDGIAYKMGGDFDPITKKIVNQKYVIKPQKHWEKDIDKIPFPAHDLIDLDMYHNLWKKEGYQVYEAKKFTMSVMARGCPNECFHCCHNVLFPGYRARSAQNLFEEVKWCYSLGIREIQYHEYNGMVNWSIVEEFCHLMIDSGIAKDFRWGWPIGIWLKVLTKEKLKLMRKAGMDYLCLAIESYDQAKLSKVMKGKDVDLKHTLNVIKWGRDFGYQLHAFFMLGLEGQTKQDIEKTIEFSKTLDLDSVSFFIAQPLPRTKMWTWVKENNLFYDDFDTFHLRYGKSNHQVGNLSREELEAYRHRGRKEFVESRIKAGRKAMKGKRGTDYLEKRCC